MIRHVLSDGTELSTVEGLTVPPAGNTAAAYQIIANFILDFGGSGDRGADGAMSKHLRSTN